MSESSHEPTKKSLLSNRTYNALKELSTVVLPAFGALYFALAQIWGFPKGEEVVGSLAVVSTFFGTLLKISTSSYNKSNEKYVGDLIAEPHPNDETKTILAARLNEPVEKVQSMTEATFRVLPK